MLSFWAICLPVFSAVLRKVFSMASKILQAMSQRALSSFVLRICSTHFTVRSKTALSTFDRALNHTLRLRALVLIFRRFEMVSNWRLSFLSELINVYEGESYILQSDCRY